MNIFSTFRTVRPDYVKVKIPSGESYLRIKKTLRDRTLYTVCEEAKCPNVSECWESGTATFMIMGSNCSRGCRFCGVTHGHMLPLDPDEPAKVVQSAKIMGLTYVVVTSVDRDDLPDQGAAHFATVLRELKQSGPLVEVLIPDFRGEKSLVDLIIREKPAVLAHNIETVRRLTPTVRDARAGYDQSLEVLRYIKQQNPNQLTKSSLMLGLGESDDEVVQALRDLREANVDIVTIGQYLRPTKMQLPVVEYTQIDRFKNLEDLAYSLGFSFVASGPLVRTSYRAAEAWAKRRIKND